MVSGELQEHQGVLQTASSILSGDSCHEETGNHRVQVGHSLLVVCFISLLFIFCFHDGGEREDISSLQISDSSSWMVAQRPLMSILGTLPGMPCRSWPTALVSPVWRAGPSMSQELMETSMSRVTSTSMMLYLPGRRK